MFGDYDKFYQNIFANSAVLAPTATLPERVKLGAYNNRNDRQNLFSQTDLIWENRLGGHRPDFAVRLRGRPREVAQLPRLTGTFSGAGMLPTARSR